MKFSNSDGQKAMRVFEGRKVNRISRNSRVALQIQMLTAKNLEGTMGKLYRFATEEERGNVQELDISFVGSNGNCKKIRGAVGGSYANLQRRRNGEMSRN